MSEVFSRDATSYKPGDVVAGRYRVRGVLGKGGFGAVYSGEHLGTHQVVAIKMLAVDPREVDDNIKRRFLQEARITASLGHPNTVRVFDVGQAEDGPLFLVMELLRGPTLEQVLRRQEERGEVMTDLQAIDLAIPILRSLAEAHEAGLVHRDLKPANVMLAVVSGDDPVAKVLDFGLARASDSSITGEGKSLGTPAYMSPEQCQGGEVDGRSDLYALGVMLFRCLAGRLPFVAPKPLALMYMHANEPPPDLAELAPRAVHPGLCAAILRSLAKTREARFAHAQEMREVLEVLRDECLARDAAAMAEVSAAPTPRVGTLTGMGTSLRKLVEVAGPLPPMLEPRRGPWPDEATGPVTREHEVSLDPPTLQTAALVSPPARTHWTPWAIAGGLAVLLVALLAWTSMRGKQAPAAPVVSTSDTAAVAPPAPAPAIAALPRAATVSEVPDAAALARQLAARKVEQALTAQGEARVKLLRQAVALEPDNPRLRTLLATVEKEADEQAAQAAAQAAADARARAAQLARERSRKKAPPKPAAEAPAVRPAVLQD